MFTSCWLVPRSSARSDLFFSSTFLLLLKFRLPNTKFHHWRLLIAISPSGVRTSSWNRPLCMLTLTSTFPPYLSLLNFVELHLTVVTRIALLRLHMIAAFYLSYTLLVRIVPVFYPQIHDTNIHSLCLQPNMSTAAQLAGSLEHSLSHIPA